MLELSVALIADSMKIFFVSSRKWHSLVRTIGTDWVCASFAMELCKLQFVKFLVADVALRVVFSLQLAFVIDFRKQAVVVKHDFEDFWVTPLTERTARIRLHDCALWSPWSLYTLLSCAKILLGKRHFWGRRSRHFWRTFWLVIVKILVHRKLGVLFEREFISERH